MIKFNNSFRNMKRKKQTEEDGGEEESSAIPNEVQSGHESPSDSQQAEMEDSLAGTPSKKRFVQPGGRVKASNSDENGDKEQLREPRSSTTPRPKISRELARLQWESEGVKVSKARTSSVEKARPQLYEDSQQRDPKSAVTLSKADNILDVAVDTPTKRTLGDTVDTKNSRSNLATPSKSVQGKRLFSTPAHNAHSRTNGTPRIPRNADRSARRKTTKTLIERTILGSTSDNDENEQDILEHIYGSDADDHEGDQGEGSEIPVTPSKKRGRAKREPSPLPSNLPPHELYFAQNRGRTQTSNNNLSSLALLDHEEYFSLIRNFKEPHSEDIDFLMDTHAASFDQWQFELSQDFNICIFGWGSKRLLLNRFAEHVYNTQEDSIKNKIVIVNGYVPNLTIRDVLNTVAGAVSKPGQKLGSQPAEMLENIMSLLDQDSSRHITVIINSIDRAPLRRPTTQTILSRLSSHPQISLIASADHPSFPLLWDTSLRSTYNFIFHDCTTFQPYTAEVDVVDEVHELLGRSGRRVGGKEGVSFVLKSLPENAKNLFRVLIGEQLIAMEESSGTNDNDNDDDDRGAGNVGRSEPGVEYRVLYQKAVEEFICSNEMNFRTLLKEFHDHQMIQSRKDALGTELLSVPFRKEELETILEDIV